MREQEPGPGAHWRRRRSNAPTAVRNPEYAQSGQEVERREDPGGGGLGSAASVTVPGIVANLTGFGVIAQALEGDRGMDHVMF
jgi:hypothetical protein